MKCPDYHEFIYVHFKYSEMYRIVAEFLSKNSASLQKSLKFTWNSQNGINEHIYHKLDYL